MLPRLQYLADVLQRLDEFPIVALLGARQVGKTTLARQVAATRASAWFDLESPRDAARLADPLLALESLRGLVVLDEVQRAPDLFPVLRVLADSPLAERRFLVLGSATPERLRQGSESLAGRIAFVHLGALDLAEVGTPAWQDLWIRGGFPRSFLAPSPTSSRTWRDNFIQTFLARDLPAFGVGVPPTTMRRFWTMLAHYHGQIWNGAELARAFAVSEPSVRRYLDHLAGAYALRVLPPWHANLGKRQVRSPKVYVADSGILHALLNIGSLEALQGHPKVGASWEGFALSEVIRATRAEAHECFFWATHQGAELDLLVTRGQARLGFEFKYSAAPVLTRSMTIARDDLGLDQLDVLWPGRGTWPMADRIRAVGIEDLLGAHPAPAPHPR